MTRSKCVSTLISDASLPSRIVIITFKRFFDASLPSRVVITEEIFGFKADVKIGF